MHRRVKGDLENNFQGRRCERTPDSSRLTLGFLRFLTKGEQFQQFSSNFIYFHNYHSLTLLL